MSSDLAQTRLRPIKPAIAGRTMIWVYECRCGAVVEKLRREVDIGRIKSCGSLNNELRIARNTTHGRATRSNRLPEYVVWCGMKQRCSESASAENKRLYFDRGVRVCERWSAHFEDFLADMGARPSPKHSLDRIDNNRGYEPGNVRWATAREQRMNQRRMKPAEEAEVR